jgi:hypothetical protein
MCGAHHRSMTTQQLGFSVLTAPIAAMDRRALSQAWYSALHLARNARPSDASPQISRMRDAGQEKKTALSAPRPIATRATQPVTVHRESEASHREGLAAERRSMRSPLARKIEHLFLRPNRSAARATFTIDRKARVHVSMQQTSSGLRLVAVCPSRSRATVARALEQARYALAARGIALDARITE